jgi:hypothetical protein
MPSHFQGHGVEELAFNILRAIFAFVVAAKFTPKIGRGMKILDWLGIWCLVVILPNTSYAFFEIKHLIFADGVADLPNIYSKLVFGGVALIGLLSTIYLTVHLVNHYAKNTTEVVLYLGSLSVINGFGATAGLLDFYSYQGFWPPNLIQIAAQIVSAPNYFAVATLASILFYAVSLIFIQPTPRSV